VRSSVLAIVLVLTACSTHGESPPDGAAGGDFKLTCESDATQFPLLDKRCVGPSDCAIARHMISCCGTMIAIGLANTSTAAFDTSESACAAGYPGCGCASLPTAAEDGRTEADGTIEVTCEAGLCATFVP